MNENPLGLLGIRRAAWLSQHIVLVHHGISLLPAADFLAAITVRTPRIGFIPPPLFYIAFNTFNFTPYGRLSALLCSTPSTGGRSNCRPTRMAG